MKNLVIISCYNNKDLVEQMKESAIQKGGSAEQCSFMLIDNQNRTFSSAAQAYNYALDHLEDDVCGMIQYMNRNIIECIGKKQYAEKKKIEGIEDFHAGFDENIEEIEHQYRD